MNPSPCLPGRRACITSLAAALTLLSSTPSLAQVFRRSAPWGPQKEDLELTLSGGGSSDIEFESGTGNATLSLGLFLDNDWEVSLRQSVGVNDQEDSFDIRGATRVGLDYHLNLQKFRPFAGITFGGGYGDDVDPFFLAGGEVGLKYYLQRKAFLFALVDYSWPFTDWEEISSNFNDGQLAYSIGIGLNF